MRLMNRRIPAPPSASRPTAAILGNERGVALVMALVLGLVGMLMIASLLYMAGTGIWTSGSKKRYQEALEASHGSMDFFAREIIQNGVGGTTLSAMGDYNGVLTQFISNADFITKLTTTGRLGVAGYPDDNPDVTLTLVFPAPTPNVTVNNAILSTNRGNSGTSANILIGGGVVNSSSGTVTPQHIPYLYHTETQGQRATGPRERARLSAIYAY